MLLREKLNANAGIVFGGNCYYFLKRISVLLRGGESAIALPPERSLLGGRLALSPERHKFLSAEVGGLQYPNVRLAVPFMCAIAAAAGSLEDT